MGAKLPNEYELADRFGVNMEISERLKLLGYEAINGLAMMAVSTLVFGVLKLAG